MYRKFYVFFFLLLISATCRAAKDDDADCSVSSSPLPVFEGTQWGSWWNAVTAEAVRTTCRLNDGGDYLLDAAAEDPHPLEIPVFVMNRADRPDRRKAIGSLLSRVGFTNISFPETVLWHDIDVQLLENSGKLHRSFKRYYSQFGESKPGYLPFIANAISQLETIEKAIAGELPLFAIMEDDLFAGSSLANTNCRIRKALKDLPASADMLYLEVCHELCSYVATCPETKHLLRLHKPQCTGAVIYTLKGARKVLRHASPVWDFIDRMYGYIVQDQALEVRQGFLS
jgi:hypothetical protein